MTPITPELKLSDFTAPGMWGIVEVKVLDLYDPANLYEGIAQKGTISDRTCSMEFTYWITGHSAGLPLLEAGKSYRMKVVSGEWQGRINVSINRASFVEEIEDLDLGEVA